MITIDSKVRKFNFILFILLILINGCIASQKKFDKTKTSVFENRNEIEKDLGYFGIWQIMDYKFGSISALDEAQAKAYVGEVIFLDDSVVNVLGNICENPDYITNTYLSNQYVYEMYRSNANDLGIKSDSLTILSISCENNSYEGILSNGSKLIMIIDGVFFFMERAEFKNQYSYDGIGSFERTVEVRIFESTKLLIEYQFYSEPDQLIFRDSHGNKIFETEMKSTNEKEKEIVELQSKKFGIQYIRMNIRNESENSRWQVTVTHIK